MNEKWNTRVIQIPKSYLKLQEALIVERERRDAMDEVQYLTDLELEQIIEQTPDSDIKDYEDLQTGNPELISELLRLHFSQSSALLTQCSTNFLNALYISDKISLCRSIGL